MITEEQKERRKSGLFSSDVARIMTGHEVKVALEKLGQLEEEDFGDVLEINIGWKAEPLILDAYEQQIGVPIVRNLDTLLHPSYPWLGCHRDAVRPGVNIEAKTVGFYNRDQWGDGGDEVPDYVLWQVQQQMAISGDTITDIPVCFITSSSLKYLFLEQTPPITVFQVKKDYELEDFLIQKSNNVWECIQKGITPFPKTLNDIKLLYSRGTDQAIEADDRISNHWLALTQVKIEKGRLEKEESLLKFEIQNFMKEYSILKRNGFTVATWKNSAESEYFDEKRFAEEHPELYKQYLTNKSGSRRFLLKSPKE